MSQMPNPNRHGCPEFRRLLAMERRRSSKWVCLGWRGLSWRISEGRGNARPGKDLPFARTFGNHSLDARRDPASTKPGIQTGSAARYRGEFGAMPTKVPGIQICDLLPMSARIMDRCSHLRSLHHTDAGHSSGDQICFTGYPAEQNVPADGPGNSMPSCGSIVAKQFEKKNRKLPAYVMIPRMVPGTGAAWLGRSYDPFETIAEIPIGEKPFKVPNLSLAFRNFPAAPGRSALASWVLLIIFGGKSIIRAIRGHR